MLGIQELLPPLANELDTFPHQNTLITDGKLKRVLNYNNLLFFFFLSLSFPLPICGNAQDDWQAERNTKVLLLALRYLRYLASAKLQKKKRRKKVKPTCIVYQDKWKNKSNMAADLFLLISIRNMLIQLITDYFFLLLVCAMFFFKN